MASDSPCKLMMLKTTVTCSFPLISLTSKGRRCQDSLCHFGKMRATLSFVKEGPECVVRFVLAIHPVYRLFSLLTYCEADRQVSCWLALEHP